MQEFISVEEARSLVFAEAAPQPVVRVRLADASGLTLAEPIRSREPIPPFDNAAMDGFAVRSADLAIVPAVLRVTEAIPAGAISSRQVASGTCARIMTGAPFPDGADAVVPVEWTEQEGAARVKINRSPSPGQYVRRAGNDVREGEAVFETGQLITPPVIGMLASLGCPDVAVYRPPKVVVIATGDELVDAAETPGPGRIRDSNGPALAAQATSAGAEVVQRLRVPDDKARLRRAVENALEADVLVFSGGVSVGDYDYVRQVLDEMGMEWIFWKVRQRPGKPLAFGRLAGRIVFGLPGNPVSSAVCFEQYVRPVLARMLGRRAWRRTLYDAYLAAPTPKKAGLHHFVRGRAFYDAEGRLAVRDTGDQASNLYSSIVRANSLIHLPEALEDPPAGMRVQLEWLTWHIDESHFGKTVTPT